jgi:hypothetical protein
MAKFSEDGMVSSAILLLNAGQGRPSTDRQRRALDPAQGGDRAATAPEAAAQRSRNACA